MKFVYGVPNHYIDVTAQIIEQMIDSNDPNTKYIHITNGDDRRMKMLNLTKDPIYGTLKHIKVNDGFGNVVILKSNENVYLKCHFSDNKYMLDLSTTSSNIWQHDNPVSRLVDIHNVINIKFGTFNDEYPEQLMSARFLTPNKKVLEIGGNIGRNSLVISNICGNNLVVLETDATIAKCLEINRDLNDQLFHIENSALSYRPLYQSGWQTYTEPATNRFSVNVITLEEIIDKYQIVFDTLVLDCEGAFFNILLDCPQILDNITLIIMENDYLNIEHKHFVDRTLVKKGFSRIYVEAGGWGPCYDYFFETWSL